MRPPLVMRLLVFRALPSLRTRLPYFITLVSRSYREMLEQPGPHDVGGDLREDAALFLPLLVALVVVLFASAVAGAHARVAQE